MGNLKYDKDVLTVKLEARRLLALPVVLWDGKNYVKHPNSLHEALATALMMVARKSLAQSPLGKPSMGNVKSFTVSFDGDEQCLTATFRMDGEILPPEWDMENGHE